MLTFIFVVLLLFLIPGPAVFLTISQSIKGGLKAGLMTGVGIAAGDLVHAIAAVVGLSAIILTSALAFEIIKYLGAGYLIYLGIRSMLEKQKKQVERKHDNTSYARRTFRQALLIELLNPKTALFFLAFLPQFVENNGLPVVYQLLMLGVTFVLMSILYTSLLALLASTLSKRLFNRKNHTPAWANKVVGVIYIGLGLQLFLSSQK